MERFWSTICLLCFLSVVISTPNDQAETNPDTARESRTFNILGFGSKPKPKEDNLSCIGAKNENGKCVAIENCVLKELKEDYVKYRNYFCIIDKGLYREVGVCCPENQRPEADETLETAASENRPPLAPPPVVTIESNEVNSSSLPEDVYAKLGDPFLCGYNGKKLTRIVGGRPADKKDWPWMAVVLRREDHFHYCGGALITKRHVITAAHCVHRSKKEDMLIRLGEYDFTRLNETRATDFDVEEIRTHEDFDASSYENDIAILKLAKPAVYGMYSQPLCLPMPGPDYLNTTCVVAGWGTLAYGGQMSDVLMEVIVPVWDQDRCVSSFAQTIFETTMCAGAYEGGKDSCQGDSGGPLMMQREDNRWVTIGVVSWGVRCGEKGKPGIYTRVNKYLDWIATKIQDI